MIKVETNPMNYGTHNNLYFKTVVYGLKFEVIANFETENAFVTTFKGHPKHELTPLKMEKIYKAIKDSLSDFDFNLKTPIEQVFTKPNKIQYEQRKQATYGK
jgi:hypothetical protein